MLKEITLASAVVALLVLNGCGGGNPKDLGTNTNTPETPNTGIEIPDALNKKADINDSTASNFMRNYYEDMSGIDNVSSNSKGNFPIKGLKHFKIASQPALNAGNDDNVTLKDISCSNDGTFSFKREVSTVTEDDMKIEIRNVYCSANNCTMNVSDYNTYKDYINYCTPDDNDYFMYSSQPQGDNTIRTYNGSVKIVRKDGEPSNENATSQKESVEKTITANNLTYTEESTSSDTQYYKFSNGKSWLKEIGTDSNNSEKDELAVKGDYQYKRYDRNKTNTAQIFDGVTYKSKLNWTWNSENNDTIYKETFNGDGYVLIYNVNGSENNKTINSDSWAYDNVTYEKVKEGNVTTLSINGGVNNDNSCGKMLNFTTDKLVKRNKTFKDDNGDTGSVVLPYDGKVTLKGKGVAEATFNVNDENVTSMTLKINGVETEDSPYYKWSDVPHYMCGSK